jgi:hypothetical protein
MTDISILRICAPLHQLGNDQNHAMIFFTVREQFAIGATLKASIAMSRAIGPLNLTTPCLSNSKSSRRNSRLAA